MAYHYSFEDYNKEQMTRAYGLMPISRKKAIEICNFVRYKNVSKAKKLLEGITEKKYAVPVRRYKSGIPHRKSIGPGKFPVKASKHILKLLNSAEANAQFKGMNSANMVVKHISIKTGGATLHMGRHRSRKMKRCYVEIVLAYEKGAQDNKPK